MSAAAIDEYRFKFALNFDQVFATFLTSPNSGFLDDNVNRNTIDTQPTTGTDVRIVFDPSTYAINDNRHFWLQFFPVTNGIEGVGGAPTLVLPDGAHYGTGIVVIQGEAPNGSTLQLDLPRRMEDFRVTNEDGVNNLLVGTEDGGPMTTILPLVGVQNIGYSGEQGSLYVEGVGGDVPFSATFTLAFPR
jgi:hypothetical protein